MGVRLETTKATTTATATVDNRQLSVLCEGAAEIRNKNARRTPSGCATKLE